MLELRARRVSGQCGSVNSERGLAPRPPFAILRLSRSNRAGYGAMPARVVFSGRFKRVNEAFLRPDIFSTRRCFALKRALVEPIKPGKSQGKVGVTRIRKRSCPEDAPGKMQGTDLQRNRRKP